MVPNGVIAIGEILATLKDIGGQTGMMGRRVKDGPTRVREGQEHASCLSYIIVFFLLCIGTERTSSDSAS